MNRPLAGAVVLVLHGAVAGAQPVDGDTAPSRVDVDRIRAAKRVLAVRIDSPIEVDGVLDEEAWRLAEPAVDFYQQAPSEFALATRHTEVRFLYDDAMLYVGAMLYDEAPERAVTNDLKRDFNGRDGDLFGLVLDTFRDQRNSFGFLTNPGGAQRDTQAYENGRRNDANWHGIWFARTALLPNGWSIEYAIPFRTLRFRNEDAQEWGLNMVRIVRRDNEVATWSPVPRQFTHYQVAYAGSLAGIAGVRPGRNLYVKPVFTASADLAGTEAAAWKGDADGGLDVKWGITPSLTTDITLRTDFSQVEADEQQINLTRFSLFFPEKREFFLESPASFQVGLAVPQEEDRRDIVPFFSRRIGLSQRGQPIPVLGGVRLTGRAGRQTIGVLAMQTGRFEERPGDAFTAVRMARAVTDTVSLGGFYFGREAQGAPDFNRVGGFEFRMTPRRTVEIEAFAMRSGTYGQPGDWAGRAGFRIETQHHRGWLGAVHVGNSFVHDLGYIRREGISTLYGSYARVFQPGGGRGTIREFRSGGEFEATTDDRHAEFLTGVARVQTETEFADGAIFRAWAGRTFEHLRGPERIGPLPLGPGSYRFVDAGAAYESNQSAALSGTFEVRGGEFWSGSQQQFTGGLRVRMSAHLATSATFSRSNIALDSGEFAANLFGVRVDCSFTPRMFLNAFVQYNGEADAWISNVRYNLIHRPLSDIYVVWNETRLPGLRRRALLLKYTHQIAF